MQEFESIALPQAATQSWVKIGPILGSESNRTPVGPLAKSGIRFIHGGSRLPELGDDESAIGDEDLLAAAHPADVFTEPVLEFAYPHDDHIQGPY